MALILIVDDSPTELHVLQRALELSGYRTAVATEGGESLRLARELRPDLILMDIVMPGMNGYQATRALRNDPSTREIPVIMLSSKDGLFDRARGRIVGSEHYLTKPFTKEELLDAIHTHISR